MRALDLVNLTPLMERTKGRAEVIIGLIDGPVAIDHPDLAGSNVRHVSRRHPTACSTATSVACLHGTFVAGMLSARRGSVAPAICPGCTLLVRPIFPESPPEGAITPQATPQELALAIVEAVDAGARIINVSAAVEQQLCDKGERELEEALGYATKRNVIIVVAAGNQGRVGSSVVTRNAWSIPVTACDLEGRPMAESNLGISVGRNGLAAPGNQITSLGTAGPQISSGTSAAVAFVTGAVALLWSEFPVASAARIKSAVTRPGASRRSAITPPLLDAWRAYTALSAIGA
jgi:subtilisin family serine protease